MKPLRDKKRRHALDLCQWKRKVPIKSLNYKDTRQIRKVQLVMGTFLETESSKLLEKPEESKAGADGGPRSA